MTPFQLGTSGVAAIRPTPRGELTLKSYPLDAREQRLAREEAATSGGIDDHEFEFFCECSNADCNLLLPMTVSEYERIRADPTQFVVAPGHQLPEIETLITRTNSYHVVVKRGEAAEFVTERDPRSE